ncbi:hypothetical protein MKUB_09380 [Mycobacterium kubicae]|nr:hypothetical protein MKUB_09380 [Mycobacterium kubicae]
MLVGVAVGQLAAVAATVLVHTQLRPEVIVALVVGIPSVIGVSAILFSGRRWVTLLGAFLVALAPGWFGVLVALRVINGG